MLNKERPFIICVSILTCTVSFLHVQCLTLLQQFQSLTFVKEAIMHSVFSDTCVVYFSLESERVCYIVISHQTGARHMETYLRKPLQIAACLPAWCSAVTGMDKQSHIRCMMWCCHRHGMDKQSHIGCMMWYCHRHG